MAQMLQTISKQSRCICQYEEHYSGIVHSICVAESLLSSILAVTVCCIIGKSSSSGYSCWSCCMWCDLSFLNAIFSVKKLWLLGWDVLSLQVCIAEKAIGRLLRSQYHIAWQCQKQLSLMLIWHCWPLLLNWCCSILRCRKGQWQTVAIPIPHFLLTWKGQLVEQKTEINAKRIVSVGISLAGGDALQPQGTFNLGLEWIKAERRLHGLRGD